MTDSSRVPEWFGSSARANAFFPVLMGGYAIFYAAWWPFAWGITGGIAFGAVLVVAVFFILRGVAQIRHASVFPGETTPEDERIGKAMSVLNSVTHPIWIIGTILLLIFGQGRWALPLMVFVIGAHFIPMARILNRKIDYLLGPVAILAAIIAGVLAFDQQVSWLVVFAVAGVGGTVSTLMYAAYMSRAYRELCDRAGVTFPMKGRRSEGPVVAGSR